MTITQLKYTLAVAEHGNFTTASDKCFVTQPTLSMQVQKLEEELGVTIFNRSTKPLQVTEIGDKILSQARKIIEESTRINDVISEEKGTIGRTLPRLNGGKVFPRWTYDMHTPRTSSEYVTALVNFQSVWHAFKLFCEWLKIKQHLPIYKRPICCNFIAV